MSNETMTFGGKDKVLANYLEQVRRYPRLTKEELATIPFLIKESPDARIRMIEGNYRLPLKWIIYLVKKHRISSDDDVMELVQAGNMGLIKAVDNFDPHKGFKFSTYADFWIKYETGMVIKQIYSENSHSRIAEMTHDQHDYPENVEPALYSPLDSSKDADLWFQHRTFYRLLMNLTPFESKILHITYIDEIPRKMKEFETGLDSTTLFNIAHTLIEKLSTVYRSQK